MLTMITKRHNYDHGYISLVEIQLGNMPEQIVVEGNSLFRKEEFHVSIMAIKNLAPLLNSTNSEEAAERLKDSFLEFEKTHNLTKFNLTGQFRLVKRDERITVVAMVELEGVEELFAFLREKHGVEFPTQPTHITIYTLQPEAGIGILSEDEMKRDSITVELPELANIQVTQ
jgi:hypothetical protein